jgi:cell division septum initiation protein DivIVA
MSEEPPFRTVLRGYDPEQVRSALDELQTSVVTARRMTADRTIELTRMQEQLATAQRELEAVSARLRELESHPAQAGTPSVTDVGARIGSILALANEEAEELRAAGREDARRRLEEADASIATARSDAERDAQQVRAAARQDAERLVEEARLRAAEVVDGASRDADAKRAEGQAIVDRHRAQADAVAAFSAQVDRHAERLQQASTRVEQLAQEEATLIQRQAQANTERIRQDTENQLAAVDARKQSITAQLDTVGALLQQLGQATDAAARTGDHDGMGGDRAYPAAGSGRAEANGQGRPEEAGARH